MWRTSSLYVNPTQVLNTLTKVLAEGKEKQGKGRTEIADKAQSPYQIAQHHDAQNAEDEDRANAAVVSPKFIFLAEETCSSVIRST